MITDPTCPLCGGRDKHVIGAQTFRKREISTVSNYVAARFRVLFEVWLPAVEEARFESVLCPTCGFVSHLPRVANEDVDAKYRFLASIPSDPPPENGHAIRVRRRAVRLFRKVKRYLREKAGATVLDFGGGDGRLMRPFVDSGFAADLIDYSNTTIEGVNKIGDTEADLPENAAYDLIICSHVIEHVADPVGIVRCLIQHLKPGGVIYVEVPMEIWGGPPRPQEPVTHVNFFTPRSLQFLIRRADGDLLQCGLDGQPHESGHPQLVASALARRCTNGRRKCVTQPIDTFRYLAPNALMKLRHRFMLPSTIPAAVLHKLGLAKS